GRGILAGRLGIGRRRLEPRRGPRRRRGGGTVWLWQRRLEDREAAPGGLRVDIDPAVLGPVHRLDVDRGSGADPGDAVAGDLLEFPGRMERLEAERLDRAHHAFAVTVEVGGDAF